MAGPLPASIGNLSSLTKLARPRPSGLGFRVGDATGILSSNENCERSRMWSDVVVSEQQGERYLALHHLMGGSENSVCL